MTAVGLTSRGGNELSSFLESAAAAVVKHEGCYSEGRAE